MLPAAAQVNVHDWQPISIGELKPFFDPIVRTANNNDVEQSSLLHEYAWMELIVPIVLRKEQTGFLALARPADGYFNVRQVRFLSRVADMIAIGSEAIFLFETSRRLSKELFKSQEAERLKLVSEIHDNPLQTLGFVKGKLHNLANDLEPESPEVAGILVEQIEYLQETIAELRNVCAGLHPAIISKGFQMIATGLAQEFRRQHNLEIEVMLDSRVPDETTERNLEAARAVFYILREALNNIVKHAGTEEACIEMNFDNSRLTMMITDNGAGSLRSPLSYSELIKGGHFGLANMLERADGVNGQLTFQPNLPQGTRVVLEVPLAISNATA
jgi:signal transduction histidine kinase